MAEGDAEALGIVVKYLWYEIDYIYGAECISFMIFSYGGVIISQAEMHMEVFLCVMMVLPMMRSMRLQAFVLSAPYSAG